MRLSSDLKGTGYLSSTASVGLLGSVSWKSAADDPIMLACLILGMLFSVVGMLLRWRSHRLDKRHDDHRTAEEYLTATSPAPGSATARSSSVVS